MDVLLFSVVVIGLAAFVAAPLYRGSTQPPAPGDPAQARRAALERAVRDLEIDRASGLVDAESYAAERAVLDAQISAPD